MPTHIGSLVDDKKKTMREVVIKVFPHMAIEEMTLLGVIAKEDRSISAYGFRKLSTSYELPSYSTIHDKLANLLRKGLLASERKTTRNRISIEYSLTLKGLLASLSSPLVYAGVDDATFKGTVSTIAKKLHLPDRYVDGMHFILSAWFFGLSRIGVDLGEMELGFTFFEETFAYILFHDLGMTARLRGCSLLQLIEEIIGSRPDQEREAFKGFLIDFIRHEWFATYSRIGYVFLNSELGWEPALIGAFPIAKDPAVCLTVKIGLSNLGNVSAEILDKCTKSLLNTKGIQKVIENGVKFVGLPPNYLCSAIWMDSSCRITGEPCIASEDENQIWKCRHLKFIEPEEARKMFGQITWKGKAITE